MLEVLRVLLILVGCLYAAIGLYAYVMRDER